MHDWLVDRLVGVYPFLAHRGGRAEAGALITEGRISLLLDGLDEVQEKKRPVALEALSRAGMRLVLLSRTGEMVAAARTHRLVDAAAVHLDAVPGPVAADYLDRAPTGLVHPAGWARLLDRLRKDPDGALAQAVSTPLALTLLRDTYGPTDDVSEVLDLADRSRSVEVVENHPLARLVDAAYGTRAAGSPNRGTAQSKRTRRCGRSPR